MNLKRIRLFPSSSRLRSALPVLVATSYILLSIAMAAPAGVTERVSVSSSGLQGNGNSWANAISARGRYVAFSSDASNLVAHDTNGVFDVFVHDRRAGTTDRVSVDSAGQQANAYTGERPAISAGGRYLAFYSEASNLVSDDTNVYSDVFVHDRKTGITERVSVSSTGEEGNWYSDITVAISARGRYVAFSSGASNLVTGDTNDSWDVFVHDRHRRTTERVSIDSTGAQANSYSGSVSISARGRYIAFGSDASNLVNDDHNDAYDVFVHDQRTSKTERVSVDSEGQEGGYNWSQFGNSSISRNGRYVAFDTYAPNLVLGDTNDWVDVFVHDRMTETTERVSLNSAGMETGGGQNPAISSGGRYVSFDSYASDVVSGDTNGTWDAFVHDRKLGSTVRVSLGSRGQEGNSDSHGLVSRDGRFVSFLSFASNLVPDDTNARFDVFVSKLKHLVNIGS